MDVLGMECPSRLSLWYVTKIVAVVIGVAGVIWLEVLVSCCISSCSSGGGSCSRRIIVVIDSSSNDNFNGSNGSSGISWSL